MECIPLEEKGEATRQLRDVGGEGRGKRNQKEERIGKLGTHLRNDLFFFFFFLEYWPHVRPQS